MRLGIHVNIFLVYIWDTCTSIPGIHLCTRKEKERERKREKEQARESEKEKEKRRKRGKQERKKMVNN